MQKFTRALTREIEIAGERLAVTLAEDGVTIRPVGSRRPPHHMSWPVVVCAVTGKLPSAPTPTAAEMSTALTALKSGAGETKPALARAVAPPMAPAVAVAASLSMPTAAPGLPALLARLDDWLARHRPRYHDGLLPGASPEDLDALAKAIGKPVPAELRQWLGWHNGQQDDLIGAFYEAFNLMSTAQIVAAWQERTTSLEPGWNPNWIPILDDYQDDLIVLDPTQAGVAVREVWRGREDHAVVASSLTAWLERFVADVEAGRFHEDSERGEFHRLSS
jgi:cell wall assembly regulator SMI1